MSGVGGTTNITSNQWLSNASSVTPGDVASTKADRVFSMHIRSASTAGVVRLFRGGSSGVGTLIVQETGTGATGKTIDFGTYGIVLNGGCYVDINSNVSAVAITSITEVY